MSGAEKPRNPKFAGLQDDQSPTGFALSTKKAAVGVGQGSGDALPGDLNQRADDSRRGV